MRFLPFEPQVSYRFAVLIPSKFPQSIFFCKAAQLPTATHEDVVVHQRMFSFKSKGKMQYEDITLTFYDAVGLFGALSPSKFIERWRKQHTAVHSGVATDGRQGDYMTSVFINVLDPKNIPIQIWKLYDAYIGDVSYGDLDWGSDEPKTFEITLKYTWAKLISL